MGVGRFACVGRCGSACAGARECGWISVGLREVSLLHVCAVVTVFHRVSVLLLRVAYRDLRPVYVHT